jgi:peptidyl-prolyl cis-trans isomerase D
MMMQGIRKAGQSWLGKLVVFVMFGFLIFSFAIWGIGDIFRGKVNTTVAKVGKVEITQEMLRTAYQNELQQVSRRARQNITPEMAKALGLDTQVLSRLVTDATLDQASRRMGVAISDDVVARSITDDAAFKGSSGAFDRNLFNDILRNAGFTEQSFVREQRGTMQRLQLAELVSGAVTAPVAIQEAAHRYRTEQRSVEFVVLPASAAGVIAAPDASVLQRYFDERKQSFRSPEFRSANLLVLTPATIADAASITDADARKRYDEVKSQRFGAPERRTIQQIVFPNETDARAALARLRSGAAFEAIATERGIADKDLTLGTFSKGGVFDKAVAEAAFALAPNTVSEIVPGAFGPVLLRVSSIEPERIRPFEEVAAEIRRELSLVKARDRLAELHDSIEDQRAGAKPLAEIAKDKGLALRAIGPVDAQLRDKAGAANGGGTLSDLPSTTELAAALFRSEPGADNEPLRLRDGGYIWFDVSAVEAGRERRFDEVGDMVLAQWQADETATRLSALARELGARLDKGEGFDAVAAPLGLMATKAPDLTRQTTRTDLPANAISGIFGTAVGKSGSATTASGTGRILFRVTTASIPTFLRTTQEADGIARQLGIALGDDLLSQYVTRVQAELGMTINAQGVRNAISGGSDN